MNKPRKNPKTKSVKAAPVTPSSEDIAPVKKHVKSFELDDWLSHIGDHAKSMAASPKGACLISDPQSGGNNCILTDEATCSKLGGTWIGGPCGPN
jgi:hypothetical protein